MNIGWADTWLHERITLQSPCLGRSCGCYHSRDITLPTKVRVVKAMVFPVVRYGCESWTIKKAEHWRIDAFKLNCCRRLLRVPWTARRSNQSILKEINPEYYWKDWCWSWSSNTLATSCEELTYWKRLRCWERLRAGQDGGDREWDGWMASSNEFEKTQGDSKRQGNLACCSPWGRKESDTTEQQHLGENIFRWYSPPWREEKSFSNMRKWALKTCLSCTFWRASSQRGY